MGLVPHALPPQHLGQKVAVTQQQARLSLEGWTLSDRTENQVIVTEDN